MSDRRPPSRSNQPPRDRGPGSGGPQQRRSNTRRPGGPSAGPRPPFNKSQDRDARKPVVPSPKGKSAAPDSPDRLQKVLAHAGVGSRRACEEMISQGRITVDGQTIRELGVRVDPRTQQIAVDGQKIHAERNVYYAVHKPKGYVTTNSDPAGKPRVIDLLPEIPQRVYAVGRLDEQSTGLLLLTNDGELANHLAHPRFGVEKVYRVVVAGEPGHEVLDQLTQGIWLAEGKVRAKRVRIVGQKGQASILEMVLAEGKNREIRRMLAKLGHKVMSLTRIAVGPIGLKGLGVGECRPLTGREVDMLRQVAAGINIPTPRFPDRRERTPRGPGGPASRRPQGEHDGEDQGRSQGPAPREHRPTQGGRNSSQNRPGPGPGGRPPFRHDGPPQGGQRPGGRPPFRADGPPQGGNGPGGRPPFRTDGPQQGGPRQGNRPPFRADGPPQGGNRTGPGGRPSFRGDGPNRGPGDRPPFRGDGPQGRPPGRFQAGPPRRDDQDQAQGPAMGRNRPSPNRTPMEERFQGQGDGPRRPPRPNGPAGRPQSGGSKSPVRRSEPPARKIIGFEIPNNSATNFADNSGPADQGPGPGARRRPMPKRAPLGLKRPRRRPPTDD